MPTVPHLRPVEPAPDAGSAPRLREQTLVESAAEGNSAAWARLYQDNFDTLYRDARYLSRDAATAEELVQEAFALGLTRLSAYDGRSSFGGWIRGIILNLARRAWRTEERRGRAYGGLEQTLETSAPRNDGPEHDLERRNRAEALTAALEQLAPALRETFVLRDVQGLSVDEVAARLETTSGNVRVRANRARGKIRDILRAMGALEAGA
ncbi:MAG: RNA polymerase sigma factor [Nannocystales bacterium]